MIMMKIRTSIKTSKNAIVHKLYNSIFKKTSEKEFLRMVLGFYLII